MKTFLTALTLVLFISLNGCSTMGSSASNNDIKFETEIDPKANFKGYKTYSWMGSASIMNDPTAQWKAPGFDANAEIKFLIDSQLRSKGMTEAARKPDVIIGYALGINMTNIEYKSNPDKSFKTLEAAPKGALVILMIDADTGVVIWASTAKADIQGNTGDTAKNRLAYAVKSMLGSLPK
ncbi:MAG: hypothetical protein DIZ80_11510 [endosymbiont of Galathealinum brachiosum]|uniref:DUF4136 domain-containing protein n=1 Tax=endosymbiont of Galathealinum brachiosum TaxID=2200906 RepID=A0A370DDA4_9GAMM|nr:MAG: hypothetical protein DIZ80_11510 [endosymbiont of Galathealinum brachiosum]